MIRLALILLLILSAYSIPAAASHLVRCSSPLDEIERVANLPSRVKTTLEHDFSGPDAQAYIDAYNDWPPETVPRFFGDRVLIWGQLERTSREVLVAMFHEKCMFFRTRFVRVKADKLIPGIQVDRGAR